MYAIRGLEALTCAHTHRLVILYTNVGQQDHSPAELEALSQRGWVGILFKKNKQKLEEKVKIGFLQSPW